MSRTAPLRMVRDRLKPDREADGPLTRLGLRPRNDPALPDDLLRLDEDRQPSVLEVAIKTTEAEQIARAKADEAGDDDEGPQPWRSRRRA